MHCAHIKGNCNISEVQCNLSEEMGHRLAPAVAVRASEAFLGVSDPERAPRLRAPLSATQPTTTARSTNFAVPLTKLNKVVEETAP